MNHLTNITLAVAVQVAAVIGARRANRARRDRAPGLAVATFTVAPGSYLAHAAAGRHGPEAQAAARRELDCLAWWEQQMGELT